ncbi:MAG: hypothetical protein RL304_1118, partial [Verrucomicrobiota bacterium]
MKNPGLPEKQGLYDPQFEHDACGVGFVCQMKGKRSHDIIQQALTILVNLDHRGACGCETNTGDGAGILLQLPHGFFAKHGPAGLPKPGHYGVGMLYVSPDAKIRAESEKTFEAIVKAEGLTFLGWRDVPTDNSSLGATAQKSEPRVRQAFIGRPASLATDQDFERKLFIVSKQAHYQLRVSGKDEFYYASSLSCRTLIYKGMLMPEQVGKYFKDLADPSMDTALALVHSRFSTNTFPSWERAHPYHFIAHNGEINTLRGNVNWMKAREPLLASPLFGADIKKIVPVVNPNGSDSAMFDNVLELMVMGGRSLPEAMMMMMPHGTVGRPGFRRLHRRHDDRRHPGPQRPAPLPLLRHQGRLRHHEDDYVIMGSEAGVLPIDPANIAAKGRLQPGRMFIVNMEEGRIVPDEEIKQKIAAQKPYREWLNKNLIKLADISDAPEVPTADHSTVVQRQLAFGYTFEDQRKLLVPMGKDGVEATGSMGTDIPLAVLSNRSKLLYDYFKQLFAQVTNPPIDCIREEIVTSSVTTIGPERNLLDPNPASAHLIELPTPIITNEELAKLRHVAQGQFRSVTIPTLFDPRDGAQGLEKAMAEVCRQAGLHIDAGINLIILSDRGVDRNNAAIPPLLAVSGLHHYLIREGKRTKVGLILESGEPREVHHFCTLIGYGCAAINPYLAFETLDDMIRQGLLVGVDHYTACKNYVKAATKGIVKVASKIGISTIQSYLGLQQKVVDQYFTGTATRIEGADLAAIAEETLARHRLAYTERVETASTLTVGGDYQWRNEGEAHLFSPQVIHSLQKAVRTGNYETFKVYTGLVNNQMQQIFTLRGLLQFKPRAAVPIEEVESVEAILKRFKSGAMSYGSISKEAHESLAIAMNRIGGKSNTGEGGEDPERYTWTNAQGDSKNSAIKQVASGRFGVTSLYLTQAKEVQIKMAQGAKPGEGGQLPGGKVYP